MKRETPKAIRSCVVTVLAWLVLAWNCLTQGHLQGAPHRVYLIDVLSVAVLAMCGGALLWSDLSGPKRWDKTVFAVGLALAAASFGLGLSSESYMQQGVFPPPPVIVPASVVSGILAFACILVGGVFGPTLRRRT
jgi:hypothetical protein